MRITRSCAGVKRQRVLHWGKFPELKEHKELHTTLYLCLNLQSPVVKYFAAFTSLYVPPGLSFNMLIFSFQYVCFVGISEIRAKILITERECEYVYIYI